MSRVKSSNSKIESLLRKALKKSKISFKHNVKNIYGKPDFVLPRKKIAIFCDSEFWHGKNWDIKKYEHKSKRKFWWNKIESNIARDKKVNTTLRKQGWKVLRFWGKDILKRKEKCLEKIKKIYSEIK